MIVPGKIGGGARKTNGDNCKLPSLRDQHRCSTPRHKCGVKLVRKFGEIASNHVEGNVRIMLDNGSPAGYNDKYTELAFVTRPPSKMGKAPWRGLHHHQHGSVGSGLSHAAEMVRSMIHHLALGWGNLPGIYRCRNGGPEEEGRNGYRCSCCINGVVSAVPGRRASRRFSQ